MFNFDWIYKNMFKTRVEKLQKISKKTKWKRNRR